MSPQLRPRRNLLIQHWLFHAANFTIRLAQIGQARTVFHSFLASAIRTANRRHGSQVARPSNHQMEPLLVFLLSRHVTSQDHAVPKEKAVDGRTGRLSDAHFG